MAWFSWPKVRKTKWPLTAILMYHRVCPHSDSWFLEPMAPDRFEEQIKYYCRNYEVISLERLAHCLRQGKPLSPKAVVITFDDGYKDNYLYAYPVLKDHGVPATIFLTTGHIGTSSLPWWDKVSYIIQHTALEQIDLGVFGYHPLNTEHDKARAGFLIVQKLKILPENKKNWLIEQLVNKCNVDIPADLGKKCLLSWEEAKEMSNNGIDFGAHTVTHPILTNMPLADARQEIARSKKDIEEMLGKKVTAFAYPNGDYNSELAACAKECGFACAVSVLPGKLVGLKDHLYELSRIKAVEDSSKMNLKMSGLWGDIICCGIK